MLCNSTPAPAQVFCLDFLLKNAPKSIPSWYVRYWFKTMDQRGWQTKEGQIVGPTNWPYYLGTFYSHASEEERAQAKRYGLEAQYAAERKARFANQKFDWTLCRERCANFRDGACSRGILVPPSAGEFPVPPEICPDFKHRND